MKKTLAVLTVGFTLLMGANSTNAVPLYDGVSEPNETLDQQGWQYLEDAVKSPAPTATPTSEGTLLDTGNRKNKAGYFKVSPVLLDRSSGYAISFSVKISSETHTNDNRAGFSLIVMSDSVAGETQPYGLELGFWKNGVWAQNVGFTQGEKVTFNVQKTMNNYVLYVKDNQYQLFINGSTFPILQGELRQYTGFTPPAGYSNPYETSNLIFLGDNTVYAKANVTIKSVSASPVGNVNLSNTSGN
ncbi:hypothetical protein [Coleofasciculus sp. FACHB-1120]|uniref:choice-of-anchor Y domain-containing protein n=1 Tax=Coleofasciculus sp. FACHB-1120 TaxID=2692783 RepID=UPI0016849E1A|nr:hypothetical protein [Coleofasciculus sp. FACHB-1120]MBD2742976.1 hypothetical protein [Coleofasciculus sp. FACHB-1120]